MLSLLFSINLIWLPRLLNVLPWLPILLSINSASPVVLPSSRVAKLSILDFCIFKSADKLETATALAFSDKTSVNIFPLTST